MAEFNIGFDITMGHEGGYSDDPMDSGGETYRGIARRYHPAWSGWELIDELRDLPNFPENIPLNTLDPLVRNFYRHVFWNVFWGDNVDDQDIANELFDTSVNMGTHRAIKFLQMAINALNKNQKLYNDIVEDGVFGRNTHMMLEKCLATTSHRNKYLLIIMNVLQGMHYIEYSRKSNTQERFMRGWLERVIISKE